MSIDNDPDDPILRRHTRIVPIRSLPHLDRVVVLVPSDGRLMIEDDPTITRESVRER